MATERKREQVALLEERLRRAEVTIGLDYRGLSVGDMQQMRRTLRAEAPETELRVIKNTLWRLAAENTGAPDAAGLAQESTALLFGFGDLTEAPKALQKYIRESQNELPIHGVYFESGLAGGEVVAELAAIPGRTELMAKVAGGLNNPVAGLAGALSAIFREVAAIVEARADQLAETEAEPAAAAAE